MTTGQPSPAATITRSLSRPTAGSGLGATTRTDKSAIGNRRPSRAHRCQMGTAADWVAVSGGAAPDPRHQERTARSGPGAATTTASSATARPSTRPPPTRIGGANDWVAVACGASHSRRPQERRQPLGLGLQLRRPARRRHDDRQDAPRPIGGPTTGSAVACGGYHTVALKSDGSSRPGATNGHGQLGDGTTADKRVPTSIRDRLGAGTTPKRNIATFTGWVAVACGNYHTVALR